MNKPAQIHQFELLVELCGVCEQLKIPYTLMNHTLWDAVKRGKYNGANYETAILLSTEGRDRLLRAELPSHRRLQKFAMRGCSLKYEDARTLLLDYRYDRFGKNPCAGVEISVAEPSREGGYSVRRPNGTSFEVVADLFSSAVDCEFEGRTFKVVADVDTFLTGMVGADWQSKVWPFRTLKVTSQLVFLPDCDVDAIMVDPQVRKTLTLGSFLKRWGYRTWDRIVRRPKAKKVDRYKLYLTRTEDRFDLWEQYYPQKERLLAMAKDGAREEELRELLEPLVQKTWYYHKKKLGFCIDEDLLQLVLPILKERYELDDVNVVLERIPAVYREKPIEELLRERGVNHPLLSK